MTYRKATLGQTVVSLLILMLLLAGSGTTFADVRLPSIIGDNMVLQQGGQVPIWGWADAGEQITVSVSWHSMKWGSTVGKDGKWKFEMNAPKTGGPYEITISGKNTVTISNILVGEVWVCSGQSNMQWSVRQADNAEKEIGAAFYSNIRLFSVERKVAETAQDDCVGRWTPTTPETVPGFSAVGYFFGRDLHNELDVPIGLIHTSWGGTPAEAWTSARVLRTIEDFKDAVEEIEQVRKDPEPFERRYQEQMLQWQKKIDFSGPPGSGEKGCTDLEFDDSTWPEMELPKLWDGPELASFDGLVWFRKEIDVPDSWVGKELILELGPIDDMDTTWINGVKVGGLETRGHYRTNRKYLVGSSVIRAGRNVIVVKVLDTSGGGGIYGKAEQMKLRPRGADDGDAIQLAGSWRYKKGFDLGSMPPQPRPPLRVDNPHAPASLYNGMIAPLIPYGIRGAIWYQGESNADRPYQYRELFPAMIKNWRRDWGQGNFPFLFVQLANFVTGADWPRLREAQTMTLALPNTGMAVTIDIGNPTDIHPRNKQDVGKRLALWALAKTYGKDLVYSGPLYKSMEAADGKIRVSFDHVGGGLVAGGGGTLIGFAVAGSDQKFVRADATIDGDAVVVSSDEVSEPVAVRYAWADNPACNLYNKAGLPASPFRTDDWPKIPADGK
ncbi:MAG: hypothetical protein JSU70_09285 [Phycisphaerales bacterium]|nr:MAG: hypothetical protein JSU70_09285 [Phycisphaerales bacterium]